MSAAIKFLIDECLSPVLVETAHAYGFHAMAVRDLGLQGAKDHQLLTLVIADDWVLVTNNTIEFRERYRTHAPLHSGVVFLDNVSTGRVSQVLAFEAAVEDIRSRPDIVNTEISAFYSAAGVRVTRSPLP